MRRHAERVGKQTDVQERDVVFSALHAADIAPIEAGLVSERLLREAGIFPQLAHTPPEQSFGVFLHGAKDARLAVFMSTGYNYHS